MVFEKAPVGVGVIARRPLHEDEARLGGEAVLARVIGQGHARVGPDAIELAPEPKRGREADRPGLTVTQPDRSHGGDDGAPGGRQIGEPGGEIAADDRVIGV